MFEPVKLPKRARAVRLEREADGRPVVLVERRPRVAQVPAADDRRLLDQVVHDAAGGLAGRAARDAGQHLGVGRHGAAGRRQQLLARAGRPGLDQRQLEQRRRLDDLLGAGDVAHAGQLHQDLILPALARDDRLGDAELVDAALDGANRLIHRLLADLVGDVRLHAEHVRAGRARLAVEGRLDLGGRLAQHAVLLGRHAGDLELGRARARSPSRRTRRTSPARRAAGSSTSRSPASARRRSGRAGPDGRRP